MKPNTPPSRRPLLAAVIFPLAILAIATFWIVERHNPSGIPDEKSAVAMPPAGAASRQLPPPDPMRVMLRPLPVSLRSPTHEWTTDDAKDPKVIERIAHNPDEFIRMVEENDRIKERQLVYRTETAAAVVQRARATGEPIRHLTLPGLGGREIQMEVTRADLAFSGLSGTFTGHVSGMPQSMVTLAFDKGREAFTVVSPEDGNFLQGHPREPGEVLVASFDPAAYLPKQDCNPILTNR